MRVFVRVVERGSFSAAAADLHLSHGMASTVVKEIEADLGVQLLRRTTRRMALTEEGTAYYDRAVAILAEVDSLRDHLGAGRDVVRGRVTLQAPVAFARLVLAPSLDQLRERYPELELAVLGRDQMPDMIVEGIDLLLFTGALPDSGLMARTLATFPVVTVAAPGYLDRHGVPETPEALAGHRLINILSATNRRPLDWRFREGERTELRRLHAPLCLESSEAAVAAAVAGAGIVQNVSYVVAEALAAGRLVEILPRWRDRGADLQLVSRQSTAGPNRLRAVAEHLADLAATRRRDDLRILDAGAAATES
ncbi:LysR family transcriptional regulator [Pseudooceanicola sp. LIPI14-2-Ac024]|uniref:LysR family transcriptional regulator n=1 Tax=Pseudooceanicola sp. LIPI14-2-Ac024 TaxID=3344875 RepID=UPI0035D10698